MKEMATGTTTLKGRTLPAEFFEKARSSRLSGSSRHLRSPSNVGYIGDTISNASSISNSSWNVCVFFDLRSVSDNDLPIGLLPIPEEPCIFLHYYNHMQACKRIFVFIQPQHYSLFTKWSSPTNVTLVATDGSIPFASCVKTTRDSYGSYWDAETVTLCWEQNIVLEHQLLWRPSTDAYDTVKFIGENGTIATAWHNQNWKEYPAITISKTLKCSQKIWKVSSEREYMEYTCHKLNLLGWKDG